MKEEILKLVSALKLNEPPTNEEIALLNKNLDFKIDSDYLEFISAFNGGSGFLKDDSFVLFWKISEIIALNPYYPDVEICNNIFFIGSGGGNQGIAFDKGSQKIVTIDFLEIGFMELEVVAHSFSEFLKIGSN